MLHLQRLLIKTRCGLISMCLRSGMLLGESPCPGPSSFDALLHAARPEALLARAHLALSHTAGRSMVVWDCGHSAVSLLVHFTYKNVLGYSTFVTA